MAVFRKLRPNLLLSILIMCTICLSGMGLNDIQEHTFLLCPKDNSTYKKDVSASLPSKTQQQNYTVFDLSLLDHYIPSEDTIIREFCQRLSACKNNRTNVLNDILYLYGRCKCLFGTFSYSPLSICRAANIRTYSEGLIISYVHKQDGSKTSLF